GGAAGVGRGSAKCKVQSAKSSITCYSVHVKLRTAGHSPAFCRAKQCSVFSRSTVRLGAAKAPALLAYSKTSCASAACGHEPNRASLLRMTGHQNQCGELLHCGVEIFHSASAWLFGLA